VELPDPGASVSKDDEIVVIESVKAASDILAPIDGEIVEVNEAIVEDPAKVNEDPEGEAWFFKIRPEDVSQMDDLMDEKEYKEFIG
jgi:glycine cleavage system H protein